MSHYRGKDVHQSNESRAEGKLYRMMVAERLSPESGDYARIPITEHEGQVEWVCRPDFLFAGKRIAVFLDGPHHLKRRTEIRDAIIDGVLPKLGYKVLRFPYRPPLSDAKAREILGVIVEAVGGGDAR